MTARPRLHTGIVKEIVTQVLKNPHLIDDCLGLITTSLPARSGLAMQMLHSLECEPHESDRQAKNEASMVKAC